MRIKLTLLDQMPEGIRQALKRFDSVFAESEFMEDVLKRGDLYQIAKELDRICVEEGVIGFHFTRAVREEIEARGLEVRTCADRQHEFISRYGDRFSEAQRERISLAWKDYFGRDQREARSCRIWFNLTLCALDNGGADRLLTYFGGEVVYMPLTPDEEVAAVLRTIGQPLIVECALPVKQLHTFCEIPWGRTWLSSHHVSINQDALRCDVDAYSREPVSVSQIVSVRVARACRDESNSGIDPTRWRDARG